MKILSPLLFTTMTKLVFLSRKKARLEICKIYPKDIYTGLDLSKDVWTLEHVVPQSRIIRPGKENDMHNLAGLHTRINSSRGNKKFGDPVVYRDFRGCRVSPTLFSPLKGKGEVARKCAYMIERYGDCIDQKSLIDIETMLLWNDMYPPGDDEKRRNERIYELQNIYNRFIEDSSSLPETFYLFRVDNTHTRFYRKGSKKNEVRDAPERF